MTDDQINLALAILATIIIAFAIIPTVSAMANRATRRRSRRMEHKSRKELSEALFKVHGHDYD